MSELKSVAVTCNLRQFPSLDGRSQGGVKFPTSGDSPKAPFGICWKGRTGRSRRLDARIIGHGCANILDRADTASLSAHGRACRLLQRPLCQEGRRGCGRGADGHGTEGPSVSLPDFRLRTPPAIRFGRGTAPDTQGVTEAPRKEVAGLAARSSSLQTQSVFLEHAALADIMHRAR